MTDANGLALRPHAELEVGWFETVAVHQINDMEPTELVAAWDSAIDQEELLYRRDVPTVEFVKALRWAERRIGIILGDNKGGRGNETPKGFRGFDPVQRAQFRKLARIDDTTYIDHISKQDTRQNLSRARLAKWADKQTTNNEETQARKTAYDNTTADAKGTNWKLLHGDFRQRLQEIEPGTVDLIITDPPYPAEFLPLWTDLSQTAARILKPQGILVALTGAIFLPEVMTRLGTHLSWGWLYIQPMPGQQSRIMGRHVIQAHKPWLAYSNGAWPSGTTDWHPDLLDPSVRSKDRYRWEQDPGPTKMLINDLSPEDGIVVDPFTGSGSYGEAALAVGRKFIGTEMDAERFEVAAGRLRG
jgi:site-specific DNA-methyltransferase (adenine-specific)